MDTIKLQRYNKLCMCIMCQLARHEGKMIGLIQCRAGDHLYLGGKSAVSPTQMSCFVVNDYVNNILIHRV